ncbi:hypothetical protein PPERSA_03710 [Pseudocohnilembus persalinus]|uniref:Uncharacterized protein n=1 Tax=Pseudocohnilembus persalinus TaxID=266149 RepID=A0A0V0QG54_PSEPJ|nr:hypothetical protein PPERSA_03710 [Pseudocohnilembus persalinus]|eukprot:KRX01206.1 hypothetical protein PPERSA_03710 [Pseudocohnilembus persalinus]
MTAKNSTINSNRAKKNTKNLKKNKNFSQNIQVKNLEQDSQNFVAFNNINKTSNTLSQNGTFNLSNNTSPMKNSQRKLDNQHEQLKKFQKPSQSKNNAQIQLRNLIKEGSVTILNKNQFGGQFIKNNSMTLSNIKFQKNSHLQQDLQAQFQTDKQKKQNNNQFQISSQTVNQNLSQEAYQTLNRQEVLHNSLEKYGIQTQSIQQQMIDNKKFLNLLENIKKYENDDNFLEKILGCFDQIQSSDVNCLNSLKKIKQLIQIFNSKNSEKILNMENKFKEQLSLEGKKISYLNQDIIGKQQKLESQIEVNKQQKQIIKKLQGKEVKEVAIQTELDYYNLQKSFDKQGYNQNIGIQKQNENNYFTKSQQESKKILQKKVEKQKEKLQQFQQKERKMINLLIAIKNKGIDIDTIYNQEVLPFENDQGNETEQSDIQQSDSNSISFLDTQNQSNLDIQHNQIQQIQKKQQQNKNDQEILKDNLFEQSGDISLSQRSIENYQNYCQLKEKQSESDMEYKIQKNDFENNNKIQDNLGQQQYKLNLNYNKPVQRQNNIDTNSSCLADNSIINDSDESSFGFYGKISSQDVSIIKAEYIKNHDKELCLQQVKPELQKVLKLNLEQMHEKLQIKQELQQQQQLEQNQELQEQNFQIQKQLLIQEFKQQSIQIGKKLAN